MRNQVKDSSWIKQSFMVKGDRVDRLYEAKLRIMSTASYKYTNSQLGGSFVMNPWPQFTPLADTRPRSAYADQPRIKMGRYHSEALDDNMQVVNFRLGVPKFNSLVQFFGDFYSVEANTMARQARGTSVFFQMGRLAGGVVTIGLTPIILAGKAIRFFIDKPSSRYYYLKPAMPLYWNAVTTIVNTIAVNMGIIPRIYPNAQAAFNDGVEWGPDQIAQLHSMMPGIINKSGGLDIYAISTRAQRLANDFNEKMEQALENTQNATTVGSSLRNFIANNWKTAVIPGYAAVSAGKQGYNNIKELLDTYLSTQDGQPLQSDGQTASFEVDTREKSWVDAMTDYFHGERQMGADFVSFRVDHTGTQTESFSSQTGESGISSSINSTSSESREKRFNVMDGNLSDDAISGMIGGAIKAVKEIASGVATQFGIEGVAALAGNAFVDIPDTWQGSSAELGGITLNIPLRAPYGHGFSRLQNLVVPMSCLLAMALPLSSGKHSYTSPFILEMYSEGRCQCSLGMVRDLTFVRGSGDTGWIKGSKYMAVDAQLSIVDLSKIVHMPIAPNFTASNAVVMGAVDMVADVGVGQAARMIGMSEQTISDASTVVSSALMPSTFDEDNKYTSLMAVWGSLPMEAQVNSWRKFKLRATQQRAKFEAWTSPAHLVQWAMGGIAGDVIKAVSTATDRP